VARLNQTIAAPAHFAKKRQMTRTDSLGSQQPVKSEKFNARCCGIFQQTRLAIVRGQLKPELRARKHPVGLNLPNREPLQTFFSGPRANGMSGQEIGRGSSETGQSLQRVGVGFQHQAVQMCQRGRNKFIQWHPIDSRRAVEP
jgi:hypothetical protein